MRRGLVGGWRGVLMVALVAALAVPAVASAIGISLDRSPAPPSAVQRGVGSETVNFTITYQTVAANWALRFSDPSLNVVGPCERL